MAAEVLKGIAPEKVFSNFEKLTKIPRESGNEEAVGRFIEQFGKNLGFETIREECHNVIINKPATAGYENAPTVILQGHLDMVCVKNEGFEFDFTKDAIPLVVDGDLIKTKGTTLGADNGIAVAMMMAILESDDIPHPPITALFTTEEETGMGGVINLDPSHVKGDILINIDSEEEGALLTSCAGGMRASVILPIQRSESKSERKCILSIKGLKSGHSGMEINKNRANAIKLLGRVLQYIEDIPSIELFSVSGGEKANAIAEKASATIGVVDSDVDDFKARIKQIEAIIKAEYITADPDIFIELKEEFDDKSSNGDKGLQKPYCKQTYNALVQILRLMPFGVQSMSNDIEGLVETSTNLGVLREQDEKIYLDNLLRSSSASRIEELSDRIGIIAKLVGAEIEQSSGYPAWQYKQESKIREIMAESWKDMYNQEVEIGAIHAGLECGFLVEKLGDIDMISMGPNLYDVHTPMESMSISSVQKVYPFLLDVLKRIK